MAEPIVLDALTVAVTRELRFPYAGVIDTTSIEAGRLVAKGEQLASLRLGSLQKKHQLELEDYNKIRATFEQVKRKLEGSDEPEKKYLLDRAQADLNSAVLQVELSQIELDAAMLRSPCDGLVIDDGAFVSGMAISPASYPIRIVDVSTMKVQGEIAQEQISQVRKDQYAEFSPVALPQSVYKGRILGLSPVPLEKKSQKFGVWCVLESLENLLPGMVGKLSIYPDK